MRGGTGGFLCRIGSLCLGGQYGPPGVIAGKFTVTRSSDTDVRASFPSHGDIDTDSLQEIIKVAEKHRRLKIIVFTMLGRLIPFSYSIDPGPR